MSIVVHLDRVPRSGTDWNGASLNGDTDFANVTGAGPGGRVRTAMTFDGTDDNLNLGLGYEPQTFTFAAWVLIDPTAVACTIFSNSRDSSGTYDGVTYGITSSVSWKPRFWVWDETSSWISHDDAVPLGEWVHLTVTYDVPTKVSKHYVNGVLVKEHMHSLAPASPASYNLFIGRLGATPAWPMKGRMADIRFYNVVATGGEAAAIYRHVRSSRALPRTARTPVIGY